MATSVLIRSRIESVLESRIPSALTPASRIKPSFLPTGIHSLDRILDRGLEEGSLTEISGGISSGRTTLLLSLLAQSTQAGRCCAIVDVADVFHPATALDAGVVLPRLLWVRCHKSTNSYDAVSKALRITDLILQAGGFGLVILDLGEQSLQVARRVPLTTWFRFKRAIENTPTAFVVIDQAPITGTCASLVLRLAQDRAIAGWTASPLAHATLMRFSPMNVEAALKRKPVQSVSFQSQNRFSL